jgi:hypothetical protein
MAVTGKLFGNALKAALNKEIDWDTDTIKVTLHTSAFTPDQDAHDYANDLTNEVANGNGYTTGGATLANKTITYTAGTNVIMLDADDAVWPASTITARTAVVQDTTPGSAATNPLICYQQSDADIPSTSGEWRVQWNASGIVAITVA